MGQLHQQLAGHQYVDVDQLRFGSLEQLADDGDAAAARQLLRVDGVVHHEIFDECQKARNRVLLEFPVGERGRRQELPVRIVA